MNLSSSVSRALLSLGLCAIVLLSACADEASEPLGADAGPDAMSGESEPDGTEGPVDFASAERAEEHVATSSKRGTIAALPPLSISTFLSRADAQDFIPNTPLDIAPFPGQRVSSEYNAIRYTPREEGGFGVALQVWSTGTTEAADARVSSMREQFLNTVDAPESALAEGAFTSERAGIRTVVFRSNDRAYAFALSCGLNHCRNWRPLIAMGESIAAKQ